MSYLCSSCLLRRFFFPVSFLFNSLASNYMNFVRSIGAVAKNFFDSIFEIHSRKLRRNGILWNSFIQLIEMCTTIHICFFIIELLLLKCENLISKGDFLCSPRPILLFSLCARSAEMVVYCSKEVAGIVNYTCLWFHFGRTFLI